MRRLAFAMAFTLAAGCGGSDATRVTVPTDTAPQPGSPAGAVRLLEWSWINRDTTHYPRLLAQDFEFVFTLADSAELDLPSTRLSRAEELRVARHLFVTGNDSHPPARRILLAFDPKLTVMPDNRPGKTDAAHRSIRTSFNLTVETPETTHRIVGFATFYVVRGDSARLPPGEAPSSERWWIERWEDETASGAAPGLRARPAGPLPARETTWGMLKALYL